MEIGKTLDKGNESGGVWDGTRGFELFEKGCDGIEGRGLGELKKGFIGRERVVCCGRRGGAKSREFEG